MMMDWNRKTSSAVNRLTQRAASVIAYIYALRIKEAIPLSWEKKDHKHQTRMPVWRRIGRML